MGGVAAKCSASATSAIASVIIPACNEEAVIARCLSHLEAAAASGEFDVIVVCNGCSDATALRARCFAGVRVIELGVPSKPRALNAGDNAALAWPRVFLDADIEMTASGVRALAAALARGPRCVASPRPRLDTSKSGPLVRMYYCVWTRLPYFRDGPIGAGVYAISKAGRERFASFPDLISDDGFVQQCFEPQERASVDGAEMVIHTPRSIRALVRIESRRRGGTKELDRSGLAKRRVRVEGQRFALLCLALRPHMWAPLTVYVLVTLTAELRAVVSNKQRATWARDESSRNGDDR
jgi:glycosyltransferase involved in cell wall biosynthesis